MYNSVLEQNVMFIFAIQKQVILQKKYELSNKLSFFLFSELNYV